MIPVTLRYGLVRSLTIDVRDGSTVRDVLTPENKAALGLPESFNVVIDGQSVSLDEPLAENDTVVFERQAATKAS